MFPCKSAQKWFAYDGNWFSSDCSKTMNQLQPIFNNEELKCSQKYIHSAAAFSDCMQ